MICRLLATRCCISSSSMSFSRSNSCTCRSIGAPVGNVLECQQHGGVGALLIEHLAGIEQHDAPADHGKFAVDLISLDRRLAVRDRLQEITQLRDIPLTAVDLVKQTPADIFANQPEGFVEGSAGGDDAEIVVEDHEWIADGIDDGMRECNSVLNFDERCFLRQCRS